MASLAELRVRLEGALEVLEEATHTVEHAVAQLEQGRLDGVAAALKVRDAPETLHAKLAVEKLAEREPQLEPVVERFIVAKRALLEQVHAHAAELGLEGEAPVSAVETMTRDPVLYQGSERNLGAAAGLTFFGVVVAALGWGRPGAWLFVGVIAVGVAALLVRARKLVVTAGRIVIGAQVVDVPEVKRLLIRRCEFRTQKGGRRVHWELVFERERWGESMIRLEYLPEGFRSALFQLGFPIESETRTW